MTIVKLPDGSLKEFDSAVSVYDVAKSIGSRLAKDALWGEIDDQPVEMNFELPQGEPVNLKIITKKSPELLDTMRHSCCLLYTSPSPRDLSTSRMPSSA